MVPVEHTVNLAGVEAQAAPTDAALIEQSWAEPERFAMVFDRHADEIHRFVLRRLGPQVAMDIVAEVFLVAFRNRQRYDLRRVDARPWLYGIAIRLVRGYRRMESRRIRALARVEVPRAAEPFEEQVTARVAAQQLHPRLAEVLARLSGADRDLLLLVAWADLSYEEVAQALDVPLGTVRSRLHRVRKKVRRALGWIDPTAV